ncbi:MAG TPA: Asp23/Gls24 family envelope stress response protein [Candidatus Limnocylindrales bacterium]|nr:Asp23/Gls24 family envelope stress response protein [Candidatus Limnocylindrales bacterium]
MPDDRLAGSALVTRRAVVDIVRSVALGSYGVVELGSRSLADRLAAWLGRPAGIRVSLAGDRLAIDLRLRVAHGLPIAEVARQLDSAIRFAIRQALGREVDELSIRVAGLEVRPASEPPGTPD